MSAPSSELTSSVSLRVARRIDERCDQFEEQWKRGLASSAGVSVMRNRFPMNAASDFFEVTLVNDVTVIKLLNPDSYLRQDQSNAIDSATLIHWLEGSQPPPTLSIWEQFRNDLIAFLETNTPAKVVLDFAGLRQIGSQSVISSAMNGVFMMAKKLSDRHECQWRVCGLTDVTNALYGVSSLHQIFPQTNRNQADAVAAFGTNVQPSA